MKIILIYISFLFIVLISACNYSSIDKSKKIVNAENLSQDLAEIQLDPFDTLARLKSIRTYVNKIDSIKEWSLEVKKNIYFTTEGGEAIFYNWNGKLEKITTTEYGETFQKYSNYYLKNDTLIFLHEKLIKYNRPIYHDSTRMKEMGDDEVFNIEKSKIIESESYFENMKLIKLIGGTSTNEIVKKDFIREENTQILLRISELKKVFKSK